MSSNLQDSPRGNQEESVNESAPPISDNSISTTSGPVSNEAVWEVADIVEEEVIFLLSLFEYHTS